MRQTVHKLFWAWEFEKEEAWLNEMAARGLALVSVGFCKYEFEDCAPGEYGIQLELLDCHPDSVEGRQYISFVEETGAEFTGKWIRWVYFRKKLLPGEEFLLYSDKDSRITHLKRIMGFLLFVGILNLWVGVYNIIVGIAAGTVNAPVGIINVVLGTLSLVGAYRLKKKKNALEAERAITE